MKSTFYLTADVGTSPVKLCWLTVRVKTAEPCFLWGILQTAQKCHLITGWVNLLTGTYSHYTSFPRLFKALGNTQTLSTLSMVRLFDWQSHAKEVGRRTWRSSFWIPAFKGTPLCRLESLGTLSPPLYLCLLPVSRSSVNNSVLMFWRLPTTLRWLPRSLAH